MVVYYSAGEEVKELFVCINLDEELKRNKLKKVCLKFLRSKGYGIKNK